MLTVASLVDAAIFNSRKRLGKEYEGGQYGGISGKMVSARYKPRAEVVGQSANARCSCDLMHTSTVSKLTGNCCN